MRHDNGAPLVRIYGPRTIGMRVGTVAFNLLDPDGKLIDSDHVQAAATAANISLHRTAGELPNQMATDTRRTDASCERLSRTP